MHALKDPGVMNSSWFVRRICIMALIFVVLNLVAGKFYFIVGAGIYLTLHLTLEFASIVVAMSVSLMSFYEYRYKGEVRTLLLSAIFGAVGVIDFAHTLSYIGMPVLIGPNSVNKASTFWIIARVIQSIGILATVCAGARLYRAKRAVFIPCFFILAAALSVYLVSVNLSSLPAMYDAQRLTQTHLKIGLEYAVILLLVVTTAILLKKKEKNKGHLYLAFALLAGIMSEIDFTFYSNAYDVYNLLGHVFKIISFSFILKALVDEGLAEIFRTNLELADKSRNLIEINSQLNAADKLKNEFLANINHELKTPLSAIVAFTELLLDEKDSSRLNALQRDYLREIRDSGRDLTSKIKGLLELSGILGGKVILHQEKVSVPQLVAGVGGAYKEVFGEKGVELKLICDGEAVVFADQSKIESILISLLDNALKFTDPGGSVIVRAWADLENKNARISVTDTGVGIEPLNWSSVFNMFYQVDGTSTRKYGGAGIGLTLAVRLAEMNGGNIEMNSEFGRGSEFTLIIPLYDPGEVL
ncbi:MAG: sensor histidine kinase [Desulfocucumaceae bacterium]